MKIKNKVPIILVAPWVTEVLSIFIEVYAITLFPFIICREELSERVLNHEKIHLLQQKEMLIIPFYILYVIFFLYGFVKYKDAHQAYYMIPFEQESYENDHNSEYLKTRALFSWRKYKV